MNRIRSRSPSIPHSPLITPLRFDVMPAADQFDLFAGDPDLPAGFVYRDSLISQAEERDLVEQIQPLPFQDFRFHGFTGKRRVVSFGWRYDFEGAGLQKTDD